MLRLLGETCLFLALAFALLQSVLPLWGYYRCNPYALLAGRPCMLGQFICVLLAYGLLTTAFGINDFSILYVAANSHPSLPLMYRLTAVWGAHEGSILLWIFILNGWSLAFTYFERSYINLPLVLATLGIMSACFLCFLLFTSNPFILAPPYLTGNDLNPLLQDPGFVIHPPMLYTGYVGFAVAFAITQAALLRGTLDTDWARITRHFAMAAWCFLTFGITLGSWWAYRVLGWGGFWFWDPVENASLLPWIAGTALIHVLVLTEKRGVAKSWSALLAIICFALSLLGTFLVRSGVLISAHTFANDPKRGLFLLILLAILLTAALSIYMIRMPKIQTRPPEPFTPISRETGLLANSALLTVAMLTILLGTLYPLIVDALHLGAVSVGAPYFNTVMLPLLFITMTIMGLGPLCAWQTQSARKLWQLVSKNLLLSYASAALLIWYFTGTVDFTAIVSVGLSFWIILSLRGSLRFLKGMSLAHFGFAILIMGIMLSALLSQEREVRIKPGDAVTLGPYQFVFISTKGEVGANYRGIQAAFEVLKQTRHITNLYPEKRIYTVREMVMTKVAIHPAIFRDLYIALGEPLNDNDWSVRIYYKPFIRWIWMGGLLMMLGGILALWQRKTLTSNAAWSAHVT